MSFVVILQGLPGSGKSFFLKENNLEGYAISLDILRLLYDGIYIKNGVKTIRQDNPAVFKTYESILRYRLENHIPTIIDNTNVKTKDVEELFSLCWKYEMQCFLLPMDTPKEICILQNQNRSDYKFVPDTSMQRLSDRLLNFRMPSGLEKITKQECVAMFRDLEYQKMAKEIETEEIEL